MILRAEWTQFSLRNRGIMKIELIDCENVILDLINYKKCKRDWIVTPYAFAITTKSEKVDFKKINQEIISRWSHNALNYIKTKAWKLIEEKV